MYDGARLSNSKLPIERWNSFDDCLNMFALLDVRALAGGTVLKVTLLHHSSCAIHQATADEITLDNDGRRSGLGLVSWYRTTLKQR